MRSYNLELNTVHCFLPRSLYTCFPLTDPRPLVDQGLAQGPALVPDPHVIVGGHVLVRDHLLYLLSNRLVVGHCHQGDQHSCMLCVLYLDLKVVK